MMTKEEFNSKIKYLLEKPILEEERLLTPEDCRPVFDEFNRLIEERKGLNEEEIDTVALQKLYVKLRAAQFLLRLNGYSNPHVEVKLSSIF